MLVSDIINTPTNSISSLSLCLYSIRLIMHRKRPLLTSHSVFRISTFASFSIFWILWLQWWTPRRGCDAEAEVGERLSRRTEDRCTDRGQMICSLWPNLPNGQCCVRGGIYWYLVIHHSLHHSLHHLPRLIHQQPGLVRPQYYLMESQSECSQCISMLLLCNYCVFCYQSLKSESHGLKVVEINKMESLNL